MEEDDQDSISKSQRKRELHDLKQLGVELLEFSEDALRQLALPERLFDALLTAKRISTHGARKRQLQFVGKLLKETDIEPLRAAVHERTHQQLTNTREFHQLEALRDQLLLHGDEALNEVLEVFPRADRQHLRKLTRLARQEQTQGQPKGAGKALFRHLRELQEEHEEF
jgi:ribosome-associated protein